MIDKEIHITSPTDIKHLYESIINSSDDAIISKTLGGIITSWNHSAETLFGYLSEEAIGKHISIIIPPSRLIEETEIIDKIKNGQFVKHYETERIRKDGSLVSISLTVSPIKDATGKIIGASKIARNITDKIETENKLKLSLKEITDYKYALNESSIVAITDQKGIIQYANENFCKISKYSVDELIGQDHRIINSGYHPKEYIRQLWTTISSGKIWKGELKNKAKDGTIYWVNTTIVPFLNEKGKPYQYVAIRDDITERKKSEEEVLQLNTDLDKKVLERTQELFQTKIELTETLERVSFLASIANSIQDPIISTNGNGIIAKWNDAAEKLLEWKSEEVIGKTVLEILNPVYLNESKEEIFELLKTQPYWQGEVIFYTKSHKPINLLITGSLLKDAQENIIGVLTVGRDITKRKKAEEALSALNNKLEQRVKERTEEVYKSEKKYRYLFENNPLPMLAMDLKTFKYLDVNKMALYQYGYSKEEFLSMTAMDLIPEKEVDEFKKIDFIFNDNLTNHNIGLWNHKKKDGTIITVEIIINDILLDGKEARLVLCIDVTEKKRVEEKLIKSEELYRNLFTNMHNGFAYCKVIFEAERIIDYTFLVVNKEHEELTGLKNIAGKKISELVPDLLESDPDYYDLLYGVVMYGKSEKFESYVAPLDKWFAISLYSPEKGYFVSLIDNITERKKAEKEIKSLNENLEKKIIERTVQLESANKELESFSYSVSHDLRVPLRAVNGYSKMLAEDYGIHLDTEANRIINNIVGNVQKMGHLIDDLLTFSRLGRNELVMMDIQMDNLVKSICNEIKNENPQQNIQFNIHPLQSALCDNASIKQVWINLISNAVKYAKRKEKTIIEIGCNVKDEDIIYYVKDNGVGFDMRYADKLFGVFQRLHSEKDFEGTGVGLAIVHRIITKHNGSIWAESIVNQGATFFFTLNNIK